MLWIFINIRGFESQSKEDGEANQNRISNLEENNKILEHDLQMSEECLGNLRFKHNKVKAKNKDAEQQISKLTQVFLI